MTESIHGDVARTVRVSGHRFENSPFQDRWLNEQTVMGVYAGRYYPVHLGEDVEATYWALRQTAVLYDVPERPAQISGPDAAAFLEKVVTRKVSDLRIGLGRYVLACTASGGLFMDGVLFRLDEQTFWFVQPDGPLEAWLHAHSSGFDVTISDPHSRVLQIQGPASLAIIAEVTDGQVDDSLRYFNSGFFEVGGQRVYLSRTGWTGERGYEIYTLGEATDAGRLWDFLVEAGAKHGMLVGSLASMEMRRIEAAILDSGTDFDIDMTPYHANLAVFVDLEKPSFVGREALSAAVKDDVRLFGVRCANASPGYRSLIVDGDITVGRVTAGAWSPSLNAGIGYARFDIPGEWEGRSLHLVLEDGRRLECEIVRLPFLDPEKRIPRGLPLDGD